ncbi:MAG TPA: ATP-binding protein [Candidatus Obscuribacterales bacterium]
MRLNLTLSRKALILVAVPLLFELTFVAALVYLLQQAEVEREREAHARDVTNQINYSLRLLLDGGTASVIYHLSGNPQVQARYRRSLQQFPKEMRKLGLMVRDHPNELEALLKMEVLFNETLQHLQEANERLSAGDRTGSMKPWAKMHKTLNELFVVSEEMVQKQQAIQAERRQAQVETREQLKWLIIFGVFVNILIAVCLAAYFNQGTTRRFKVLMDNTMRFAAGEKLNPPLAGRDEIAHLDKVFRDMANALEAAMKKQRAVIDNAADVICSIDADGKFGAVNPAAAKVWGWSPDELLGTRLVQIVDADDAQSTAREIKSIMDEHKERFLENRIRRKDGKLVDMLWSMHWSEAERSLFCVAHDITEQKEIERLKRDFVAMVSHDLKTPLTSIQGFLNLLSVGAYNELSKPGKESLETADRSVARLIALVNDLLDLERMESGKLELHLVPATTSGLFKQGIDSVAAFAKEKNVTINLPADSEIEFVADADRLVQVIVNLLSNAVKFSPSGGTVELSAEENDTDVRITVRDEGRGVPDHMKQAIFARFKQVERTDETAGKGTGLGLAICKAIVERHGGAIGVEDNVVGSDSERAIRGSVFWFTIPKKIRA